MRIVIAGGTGFLGRPLARALAADGHEIVVLSRRPAAPGHPQVRSIVWTPGAATGDWTREIDGAHAAINLAGESIGGRRWTAARKDCLLRSRLDATRSLASAIAAAAHPPELLISGSAVGFYGPRADEVLTEAAPAGHDFLAQVCVAWEEEARRAAGGRTRVVLLRSGLVVEKDGGALAPMLLPFRLALGGPMGSGRQYWPWIHRRDWIDLVRWALVTPQASGPLNATAPGPVTNADFARALGRALRRPAFTPAPACALRLALGEMADALVLAGQRAVPDKALRLGFAFRFTDVADALQSIFRQGRSADRAPT